MALRSLFLKPVLACTASCLHCRGRLETYRSLRGPTLSAERFTEIIREARSLGAWSLHLSGGEPTLYPELSRLVRTGKECGQFVILNTNGSARDLGLYDELLSVGLDAIILSLHGACAEVHDGLKRRPGSFEEVRRSLNHLAALRLRGYPRFLLTTQTIITRRNLAELPAILDLVAGVGVDGHGISYVEGDVDGSLLLRAEDIRTLRREVVPAAERTLARHRQTHPMMRWAGRRLLRRLYRVSGRSTEDLEAGRFRGRGPHPSWSDGRHPSSGAQRCRVPTVFAMVLAEGSVLPCNMAEYAGGPVIGNVARDSLRTVLDGPTSLAFRREGMEICARCPSHLHFHIPISIRPGALLRLALRNPAEEQKSLWRRLREAI